MKQIAVAAAVVNQTPLDWDGKLDDENLDPKTWCRFPILSGGFRRELAEIHHS